MVPCQSRASHCNVACSFLARLTRVESADDESLPASSHPLWGGGRIVFLTGFYGYAGGGCRCNARGLLHRPATFDVSSIPTALLLEFVWVGGLHAMLEIASKGARRQRPLHRRDPMDVNQLSIEVSEGLH